VTLGSWAWASSSTNGGPGWVASARELPGGDPGQPGDKQELELIGRPAAGWRARALALCSWGRPALTAVIPQGASAGHAAWDCVAPAAPGGSPVGSVGRCSQTFELMTASGSGVFIDQTRLSGVLFLPFCGLNVALEKAKLSIW
jgi:hypothetical protein